MNTVGLHEVRDGGFFQLNYVEMESNFRRANKFRVESFLM